MFFLNEIEDRIGLEGSSSEHKMGKTTQRPRGSYSRRDKSGTVHQFLKKARRRSRFASGALMFFINYYGAYDLQRLVGPPLLRLQFFPPHFDPYYTIASIKYTMQPQPQTCVARPIRPGIPAIPTKCIHHLLPESAAGVPDDFTASTESVAEEVR